MYVAKQQNNIIIGPVHPAMPGAIELTDQQAQAFFRLKSMQSLVKLENGTVTEFGEWSSPLGQQIKTNRDALATMADFRISSIEQRKAQGDLGMDSFIANWQEYKTQLDNLPKAYQDPAMVIWPPAPAIPA